jgi:hypothetical protein
MRPARSSACWTACFTETSSVTSISRTSRLQPFRPANDRNASAVAALRPEKSRIEAKTHERIVTLASKRFRENGLTGIGIAELMEEAGLTVGGFYKRFGSRDDLVAEALGPMEASDGRGCLRRPTCDLIRFTHR